MKTLAKDKLLLCQKFQFIEHVYFTKVKNRVTLHKTTECFATFVVPAGTFCDVPYMDCRTKNKNIH